MTAGSVMCRGCGARLPVGAEQWENGTEFCGPACTMRIGVTDAVLRVLQGRIAKREAKSEAQR